VTQRINRAVLTSTALEPENRAAESLVEARERSASDYPETGKTSNTGFPTNGLLGVVDVDLVDVAHEPVAKLVSGRDGCDDFLDESHRLVVLQLDSSDLLGSASDADRAGACGPEVASPVGLTEGADEAAPPAVVTNRDRSSARYA
jgi:hypothetical protein